MKYWTTLWALTAALSLTLPGCVADPEDGEATCPAAGVDAAGFCVYRQGIQETGFRCPPDRAQRYARGEGGWAPAGPEPLPPGTPMMCGPEEAPPEAVEEAWAEAGGEAPPEDAGAPVDLGLDPVACLIATPAQLDFGVVPVGEGRELSVEVQNTCDTPRTIARVTLDGEGEAFGLRGAPADAALAPGASLEFTVGFVPEGAFAAAGSVNIESDDPVTPDLQVGLRGEGAAAGDPVLLRFRVNNDIPVSIWVQLNEEDGQTAWVTLQGPDGQRIWLQERCGVPDCVNPGGVCGAALPMVRDVTGGDFQGEIEVLWDGLQTEVDAELQCESRVPAPPGEYVATFCYGGQVQLDGEPEGDATPGRVLNPQCNERRFMHPGTPEVESSLEGG